MKLKAGVRVNASNVFLHKLTNLHCSLNCGSSCLDNDESSAFILKLGFAVADIAVEVVLVRDANFPPLIVVVVSGEHA